MSAITLSAAVGFAKAIAQDVDPNNASLTQAQWEERVIEAYLTWSAAFPQNTHYGGGDYTFTSGTKSTAVSESIIWREILRAEYGNALPSITSPGTVLERMDPDTMRYWQSAVGTTGTPKFFAVETKFNISSTYNVYLYPIPTSTIHVVLIGHPEPVTPSTAVALTEITDADVRIVARFAAAEGARLMGEDDTYIQQILKPIPSHIQAQMQNVQRQIKPKAIPLETPA